MKLKILLLSLFLILISIPITSNYSIDNLNYNNSNNNVAYSEVPIYLDSFFNNLYQKSINIKNTDNFLCDGEPFSCSSSNYTNIGLINKKEYDLIGGKNSYLSTINNYWTMSEGSSTSYVIKFTGAVVEPMTNAFGIRPTIYLKNSIEVTGLGTFNEPYILE